MSDYSETIDCLRCGSTESLEHSVYGDNVYRFCSECGYEVYTQYSVHDLDTVNEERVELRMEPLTELKKPVEGWTDENQRR